VNAAGQALIEFLLLTVIFVVLIAGIARQIPVTFSKASPYLAGRIEQRLETGHGFAADPIDGNDAWSAPTSPKGGIKDSGL
jgi:hypothetical protein